MSIFDRFVQKEQDKPKSTSYTSTSRREIASLLEASVREAKESYPQDTKTLSAFAGALKAACRARYKAAQEGRLEPMKAESLFFLSEDRMIAYACVLQPENGGTGLTEEEFLSDLHYEGIDFGILHEEISRGFRRGYYRIFRVAKGTLPQTGQNGSVTEHFQRSKNARLEVESGDQVDFTQDVQLQPIRRGTIICSITPAVPGTDGVGVTGEVIPCVQSIPAKIPRGKNTFLSQDGKALLAGVDGILYIDNDRFCVHEQKIIEGDLKEFHGPLEIQGNLYIGGDVDGGINISASGDIVINGKLGRGRVTSMGSTIRVQKGIFGTSGATFLSAAGQVQAPAIEWAEIDTGTSVIAESVLNSTIHCGGMVYAMTGRGLIASSQIWAGDSVLCQRIGNQSGGRSQISVGYPPRIPELLEKVKAELAQVQATIDKLWKPIIDLGTRARELRKAKSPSWTSWWYRGSSTPSGGRS